MIRFALLLLLSSCSILMNCTSSKEFVRRESKTSLNVMWLAPVVAKGACVDSIISEPRQADNCLSWTRREAAGPLFDASRNAIYVGGSDGMLHVMSPKDGSIKKTIKLPGNLRARPILIDDALFFGTDNGSVLMVDANTFEIKWQIDVDAEVENQVVHANSMLYVVTGLATIYAIDKSSGSVKWQKKRPLPSHIYIGVQSNPLLIDLSEEHGKSILVCGHPSGRVDFYEAGEGRPLFDVMVGDPSGDFPDVATDPIFYNGSVVVASFNRGIVSLDPHTGALRWRLATEEKVKLAAADGMLFAAGGKAVIGVDAKRGEQIWRFAFDKGAPTRMIIKDGLLYFASDRNALYVLDARTGKPLGYIGSGMGFAGDLDFSSNVLYAVSTAGYLYAMSPYFKGIVQQGNW